MSEQLASTELERAEREEGLVAKGLAPGRIGTFTGAILGISTVAPEAARGWLEAGAAQP